MEKILESPLSSGTPQRCPVPADLTAPVKRDSVDVQHMPSRTFTPRQPLEIAVARSSQRIEGTHSTLLPSREPG